MPGIRTPAPLRCAKCVAVIHKKPRAKTPKYCPSCRAKIQADWKKQTRKQASSQYR